MDRHKIDILRELLLDEEDKSLFLACLAGAIAQYGPIKTHQDAIERLLSAGNQLALIADVLEERV